MWLKCKCCSELQPAEGTNDCMRLCSDVVMRMMSYKEFFYSSDFVSGACRSSLSSSLGGGPILTGDIEIGWINLANS